MDRAGQQECALQTCDSFFAQQFAVAAVTGRKHYEIRLQRKVSDFANLQ